MRLHAFLSGAWCAVLWFFTFGVARNLFGIFPRERAGEITTALFPAYFAVAMVIGVLATAALWPLRKTVPRARPALLLQALALLALASIPLFVQPALAAHAPGTPGFARLHGISMALNLFSLIAVPTASLLVSARRKE